MGSLLKSDVTVVGIMRKVTVPIYIFLSTAVSDSLLTV